MATSRVFLGASLVVLGTVTAFVQQAPNTITPCDNTRLSCRLSMAVKDESIDFIEEKMRKRSKLRGIITTVRHPFRRFSRTPRRDRRLNPDEDQDENDIIHYPLPPSPDLEGRCPIPFFNNNRKEFDLKESSPDHGPGVVFLRLFERLGRPSVYQVYDPKSERHVAVVSGYKASREFLSQEFNDPVASQVIPFTSGMVGSSSLRCTQDKKEHTQLRRLIGQALQPTSVAGLVPALQQTAESLIDRALTRTLTTTTVPSDGVENVNNNNDNNGDLINVDDLCMKYTLQVATRHIIGLDDLPTNESVVFEGHVRTWLGALSGEDEHVWKQSRSYLVDKIEMKLRNLESTGPDESTVSRMYFSTGTDHDGMIDGGSSDMKPRLSRQEIIDNTLLLILAGSETSASTLTNCVLLLGLDQKKRQKTKHQRHTKWSQRSPRTKFTTTASVWDRVVEEQRQIVQQYSGSATLDSSPSLSPSSSDNNMPLNRQIIDSSCKLIDGVIRESLRIKPIIGGSMRGTTTAIVVDGYKIPKGWGITYDRYNTHLIDPKCYRDNLSHMNVIQGFDPDRWLVDDDDNGSSDERTVTDPLRRPGEEWIPFGIGPRYCLGADLAMVEMTIFLSVLARKIPMWELVSPTVQDLDGASDITWKQRSIIPVPEGGVVIRPIFSASKHR